LPCPGFDEAQGGKALQGGLYGGDAYPELFAQGARRGQLVPFLKVSAYDLLAQAAEHAVRDIRPLDFLYGYDG
jgi:hypothetical protein